MECSSSCIYRRALSSRSYSKIKGYVQEKISCDNHPICLVQCIISSLNNISLDTVVRLITTHYYNEINRYKDRDGNTLLSLLAGKMVNYQNIIKTILTSTRIDINTTDGKGYTFLINLVEHKKCSLMIQIITNIPTLEFDFNHKADDGHTLLTLLCKHVSEERRRVNHGKLIHLLLSKGCDPNVSSPMKYIVKMGDDKIKDMMLDSGYMMDEEDIIEPNRSYLDNIVVPMIKRLRRKHKIIGMRGVLTDGTIIGAKKARTWMKPFLNQRDTADWQEYCSYIGDSYMRELEDICKSLDIEISKSEDIYEDTYFDRTVRYKVANKVCTKYYKKLVVRYKLRDGKVTIRHKISQLELGLRNKIKYEDRISLCYNTDTILGTPIEDIVPSKYITEKYQDKYYGFELEEIQKLISSTNTQPINPYTRQVFSKSFISKAKNMISKCKGNISNDSYLPIELTKVYREADYILYSIYGISTSKFLVDKINILVSHLSPDRFNINYMLDADINLCLSLLKLVYINMRLDGTNTIREIQRESNPDIGKCMVFTEIHKMLLGENAVMVALMLSSMHRITFIF